MRLISLGSLLGIGALALFACTSGGETEPGDGDGDGDGTGGTAMNTGGGSGDGDGDGDGTGGGATGATACLPALEENLLDFTYDGMGGAASMMQGAFGDYSTTLSGGTMHYPTESITADVTGDNWNLAGEVNTWSGFGFYLQDGCDKIDASMFSGFKFTISGDTAGHTITLAIQTAANEVATSWREAQGETNPEPKFGRCMPTTNEYDGTCAAPTYVIAAADLSETPTTIELTWAELTGGAPENIDPTEITSISWYFEWADAATPYNVDITLDDIGFIP